MKCGGWGVGGRTGEGEGGAKVGRRHGRGLSCVFTFSEVAECVVNACS